MLSLIQEQNSAFEAKEKIGSNICADDKLTPGMEKSCLQQYKKGWRACWLA